MGRLIMLLSLRAQDFPEAYRIVDEVIQRSERPEIGGFLRNTAEWVRIKTLQGFLASEDPEGNPWKPIYYRKGVPLLLTGLLMTKAVAAGSSPTIDSRSLLIEVPEPKYGVFHLTGTRNMPARPWLGIGEDMADQLIEAGVSHIGEFILTGREPTQ